MREEIEIQMADESLKLKEMRMQMKALSVEGNGNCLSLEAKYHDTVEKLALQHKKFMDELKQVSNCIDKSAIWIALIMQKMRKDRNGRRERAFIIKV